MNEPSLVVLCHCRCRRLPQSETVLRSVKCSILENNHTSTCYFEMNSGGISKQEVERMLQRQRERYEEELRDIRRLNINEVKYERGPRLRDTSCSFSGSTPRSYSQPRGRAPSRSGFKTSQFTERPQSSSRPQQKPKFRSTVEDHEEFNCPTCKKKFGLRIYQCSKGHSSCADCKIRGLPCGLCREPITDMRNITLEGYLCEFQGDIKCPNAGDGCYLHFKIADMESHLKECLFSEILCPFKVTKNCCCSWTGKAMEIDKHFQNFHPDEIVNNNTESQINIGLDCFKIFFINVPPYKFLLYVKIEVPEKVSMAVLMVGTTVSAKKWTYEIQVFDKEERKRKLQYNDVCLSHSTSVEPIFGNNKGLLMQWASAMTYADEGTLKFKLFLNKSA